MLDDFIAYNIRDARYFIITYSNNYIRILKNKYQKQKGWEQDIHSSNINAIDNFILKLKADEDTLKYLKEEQERISLSRTKSRIRELALSNNFEYFGTITLNGYFCNRYELDDAQKNLKKILHNIQKKNKYNKFDKLKYLIITEKHKDGAFHFHGLFSGLDLSLNEYGYFYNEDLSKLGYNSFSFIKDYVKCCNYITKYITKDCVKNSHNQIYIRSKGLSFATKEEVKPIELGDQWKFENDFCCFYDIDLNNINDIDKDILIRILKV